MSRIPSVRAFVAILIVTASLLAAAACGSQGDVVIQPASDAHDADADGPIVRTPPVRASICPDGSISAFVLSHEGQLYALDLPTLQTKLLGTVACPTTTTPWSLTASSSGDLYVIYEDWNIYRVDPKTLACTTTPYVKGQLTLGGNSGITVLSDNGVESLFVYGQDGLGNAVLAVSNLTDFELTSVGTVSPKPSEFPLELRANAFGRIFGLGPSGAFDEIDRKTAVRLSEDQTTFSNNGGTWALLTWNDTFYFFSGSAVSQYDPSTKTLSSVGSVAVSVVGATAAPCLH